MNFRPTNRSPVSGPFEVIEETKGDGRELVAIPFRDVAGAQLLASVSDNFGRLVTGTLLPQYWAAAEISVWGVIQSARTCLVRQTVRMGTGPLLYTFPVDEPWEQISVKAVNISGGKLGPSSNGGTLPNKANGFSLKVALYFQPRTGFGQ